MRRIFTIVALVATMLLGTAATALAFEPPGRSGLTGFDFPAITKGPFEVHVVIVNVGTEEEPDLQEQCHPNMPNGGAWNAVTAGPFTGPLYFGAAPDPATCEDLNE